MAATGGAEETPICSPSTWANEGGATQARSMVVTIAEWTNFKLPILLNQVLTWKLAGAPCARNKSQAPAQYKAGAAKGTNDLGNQKITFAPSCNSREVLKVLLTVPKALPLFKSLLGVPSTGWLKRLKASARNSMRRPSPQNGNCRKTDVSRFQADCCRNELREAVPKV